LFSTSEESIPVAVAPMTPTVIPMINRISANFNVYRFLTTSGTTARTADVKPSSLLPSDRG